MSASGVPQTVPSGQGENRDLSRLMRRLHFKNGIALTIVWTIAVLVGILFVAIIAKLLIQGFSYQSKNHLPLLFDPAFYGSSDTGVGPQIFNTFYILILSEIFLFPIALGAAIYTVEYAKQGPLVTAIRFAAETLAGVPSIVLGLFGFLIFATLFHFQISRLTGALTMLCLNFPLALRLFEDALSAVPREMREGGLALGTSRWRMIRTVVLPSALPGIITGLILSAGKIIGETAALVFTMGQSNPYPTSKVFTLNPFVTSDNLTIHLWALQTQDHPADITKAGVDAITAGSATLLIIILLVINIAARAIGRAIQRRVTAE